eukprot:CAMPEP_0172500928 /NCGR_PEP_ID=MMETSP1066-20121228/144213_1 /TAXON_ID=671091 /ORGANISM="Coscinodiscus wailesii, Strain CCMP2513" /LENGTH=57 /DNA_ID=CAMNT_0013275429 /DNA_START=98 /DNA_END=271 /DNA_ORIENTATION=+
MENPFKSGLGKGGRIAAWAAAFGIVAAWNYYEKEQSRGTFSSDERDDWNAKKKSTKE